MSVCPLECLRNHTAELHQMFCAFSTWPWLSPSLTALRYVTHFRFFVDDVIFSHSRLHGASRAFLSGDSVTTETTASIDFNQILLNNKDQQVLHIAGGVAQQESKVWYVRLLCYSER